MDRRDRRVVGNLDGIQGIAPFQMRLSAYRRRRNIFHVITKQVRVEFGSWAAGGGYYGSCELRDGCQWEPVGTSGCWPRPIEAARRWIKHRVNRCKSPAEALNMPHSDRASRATGATIWRQPSGHLSIWHLLLLPPWTGASQGHGAQARTGWCHWWWVVGCGSWWC